MLWGFSIAFSDGGMAKGAYNLHSVFGSMAHGALRGVTTHRLAGGATYPLSVQVVYQLTFAIITVGLVTGAYAERMRYSAVLLFSSLWLAAVYCPLAHMVWAGDGALLHDLGALDYAGGLVVHISSGTAGLVTALCIGKRAEYPRIPHAPHSLVLSHVGASLLWVGWFGFNAGSAGAASFAAGQAMLVTHTASATGAVRAISALWMHLRALDASLCDMCVRADSAIASSRRSWPGLLWSGCPLGGPARWASSPARWRGWWASRPRAAALACLARCASAAWPVLSPSSPARA